MPGRGKPPSGRAIRRNRVEPRAVVKSDGKLGGPELPDGWLGVDAETGAPIEWHAATKAWWENWRSSPQGTRMVTDVDWDFLLDTARMHHEYWTRGRWEFGAELRLRVAKFGATPEDRARLRFEIETTEERPAGKSDVSRAISGANDRRRRLTAVPDLTDVPDPTASKE